VGAFPAGLSAVAITGAPGSLCFLRCLSGYSVRLADIDDRHTVAIRRGEHRYNNGVARVDGGALQHPRRKADIQPAHRGAAVIRSDAGLAEATSYFCDVDFSSFLSLFGPSGTFSGAGV